MYFELNLNYNSMKSQQISLKRLYYVNNCDKNDFYLLLRVFLVCLLLTKLKYIYSISNRATDIKKDHN